ncbi:hypothetical protein [Haliangium sp.]|uniref:hypothetical protein n=1 Tax=Haliangium sp. TaxID=2663208 RepID=UPI003D13D518
MGDTASNEAAPQPSADAVRVTDATAAKTAIGARVELTGTARNAKLAPVVIVDDLVVYCLDRESWPAALSGKQVTVRGTLVFTEEFQAKTSPTGEISQGTDGGVYALRVSELVPPP